MRSIAEINHKIQASKATVLTVEEIKARVRDVGVAQTAQEVDVITTGTFEPMESSGAILNLGQTDPPIKIRQCWLDLVPAYAGFGAVDLYLGASQMPDYTGTPDASRGELVKERGGGHVIEDPIAGRSVKLRAIGQVTDCYPAPALKPALLRT